MAAWAWVAWAVFAISRLRPCRVNVAVAVVIAVLYALVKNHGVKRMKGAGNTGENKGLTGVSHNTVFYNSSLNTWVASSSVPAATVISCFRERDVGGIGCDEC